MAPAVRLVAAAVLLALGVLTVLAASDRAGASVMDTGPLSTGKAGRVFVAASKNGDGERALAAAEQLARWAPFHRGSLSAYGVALALIGDDERAGEALRMASSLGWRDEIAQTFAVRQALIGGEPELAAFRMEALLRSQPDSPATRQTLNLMLVDDAARGALASRMGSSEDWPVNILKGLRDRPADQIVRVTILLAEARAAGFNADSRLARWETSAIFAKNPQLAWTLWLALEGEGGLQKSGIWDDGFVVADKIGNGAASPFEWRKYDEVSMSVRRAESKGNPRIEVMGGGLSAQVIARQSILLAPGLYAATWNASTRIPDRPDLYLTAVCTTPTGSVDMGPIVDGNGQFVRVLDVRESCPAVQIRIFSPTGDTSMRWISEVGLSPID